MSMHHTRGRTLLALAGLALLVALVSAGCGRRLASAAGGTVPASVPTIAAPATAGPSSAPQSSPTQPAVASPATSSPVPSATPVASLTSATQATPVPTPDLAGIQELVDQLGRDLQADASASTSEGSPR